MIALLIILLVALLVLFCYFMAFYSPSSFRDKHYDLPNGSQYRENREYMLSLIKDLEKVPYEDVSITSFDGLRLAGRYYHQKDGAPVEIEFHGYKGTALRDFCGGNRIARSMGHNVLLVDQRSHGRSEGRTISFGIKERRDVLSWVEYVSERFGSDCRIILSGVSMGAATVLMASGLQLPECVKGIIADCPYSSPEAIIRKVMDKDMHIPSFLLMPFVRIAARVIGGFSLRDSSPVSDVEKSQVPILLIHGTDDRFVPCSMSSEIAAHSDKASLVLFEGAGHGLSFIRDEKRYIEAVRDFEARILSDMD